MISNNFLYLNSSEMLRVDLSSARDTLNGYQKGKCFLFFQRHFNRVGKQNFCDVDHFFLSVNKQYHLEYGSADVNGVWNLVLSNSRINRHEKEISFHTKRYLERITIEMSSTSIVNIHCQKQSKIKLVKQKTQKSSCKKQFDIARTNCLTPIWEPLEELPGTF